MKVAIPCPIGQVCLRSSRPPSSPPLPPFVPQPSAPPYLPISAVVSRPSLPPGTTPPPYVPIPSPTCDGEDPDPRCAVTLQLRSCLHPDYLGYDCLTISRPFFHAFLPLTCIDQEHNDITADCFENTSPYVTVDVFFSGVVLKTKARYDQTLPYMNAPV